MEVLKFRKDANSPWVDISSIVGEQGPAGKDGTNGKDGADGYTPIKGVDYFDGANGADGYTPVKGTDYFTEADKQEIVQLVLASVVDGNEVSY